MDAGLRRDERLCRDDTLHRFDSGAAHALKSSAANVGAELLSGCYRELEVMARAGRIDAARAAFEQVRHEHEHTILELHKMIGEMA